MNEPGIKRSRLVCWSHFVVANLVVMGVLATAAEFRAAMTVWCITSLLRKPSQKSEAEEQQR